ncbi:chromosome segregation protein SMC [Candidatus Margulisiibacteriota bacterium]
MYIKKIEINGFKSFADKASVEFPRNKGILSIVGPNGCGKSNFFDALRWALGEHNTHALRGDVNTEIIFSGSQDHPPLSMAEVVLTIDNSDKKLHVDYEEVEIKRRVYRSGESEFFINKTSCRLKDILDLLMDTGIGKGSFVMIKQGEVEKMIMAKPEERRMYFEELAGINKYKTKKRQAQKKLENTEKNLIRVSDIRAEQSSRIGPLKEQAVKAQEYLTYKNELKAIEVSSFKHKLLRINDQYQEIHSEVEERDRIVQNKQNEMKAFQEKKSQKRTAHNTLEHEMDAHQENILKSSQEKDALQNQIKLSEERKTFLAKRIEEIKEEINLLNEQTTKCVAEKEINKKKAQNVNETFEQHKANVENMQKILNRIEQEDKQITQEKEEAQTKLRSLEENIHSQKDTNAQFQHKKNYLLDHIQNDQEKVNRFTQEKNKIEEQHSLLKINIDKTTAQVEEKKKQLTQLLQQKNNREESLLHIQNKKIQMKENYDTKSSRLKVIQELQEGYEGFYKGVRSILMLKKQNDEENKGIHGVIADLIRTGQEYETAIETALSSRLQHIVVDTGDTAKKCIEHLKKHNQGRATFIPLSLINEKTYKYQPLPYGVKRAYEVIQYSKNYENVFQYLLGTTAVVNTIEEALDLRHKLNSKEHYIQRIITKKGEVVTIVGTITGGSSAKTTPLILSRQRERLELSNDIASLKKEITDIESEEQFIRQAFKNLEKVITATQEDIHAQEVSLSTLQTQGTELQNTNDRITEEIEKNTAQIQEKKNQLNELNATLQNNSTTLQEKMSEQKNTIDALQAKENAWKAHQTKKEDAQTNMTTQKVSLAQIEAEYYSLLSQGDTLETTQTTIEQNTKNKQEEINTLHTKIQEINTFLEKTKNEIPLKEQALSDIIHKKDDMKKDLMRLENELEAMERQENILHENERELHDNKSQIEIKFARIQQDKENILIQVLEDFDLDEEGLLATQSDHQESEKDIRRSEKLRRQMRSMEPVNVLAIDECTELENNLTFLEKEVEDLETAKQNLRKMMKELDDLAMNDFMETFNQVSGFFTENFSLLFQGGEAKLFFTGDENPLEAGIEIAVRPPGKKMQNLTLLSGGEKSLVAATLLFSFLKYRPSPFIFLDEVDAALDEANVIRFTRLLKEYAKNTQIIIITHNKITMTMADILYGVTMEKPGISKLISMRLKKESEKVKA